MKSQAERVAMAYWRHTAGIVRPPRFLDVNAMARELERFEFVMQFVAYKTRDKKGRALTNGMQARKLTGGGWQSGMPDIGEGAWQTFPSAAKAYDYIRRSPLNVYAQEADALRVDLLTP